MKTSAGLLLFREADGHREVLLVHPGGPFWAQKDAGAWSIPKGEFIAGEDPLAAAVREFTEELGTAPPAGPDLALGSARQSSAKTVTVFARAGDFDAATIASNLIEVEWPPRSGRKLQIPEVDRAGWWTTEVARERLVKGQLVFLDRLADRLGSADAAG